MDNDIVRKITDQVVRTFNEVEPWSKADNGLRKYLPKNGGWSIEQNLEHISLTNYYLLILIKKGTSKAIELSKKMAVEGFPENYVLEWGKLEAIRQHKSFEWIRPPHMEPMGNISPGDIYGKLIAQKDECLQCLTKLQNGQGVLYKTMMSVNGIGKIDVYHYILFLAYHIKRHITQMENIKLEFDQL